MSLIEVECYNPSLPVMLSLIDACKDAVDLGMQCTTLVMLACKEG